MPLHLILMHSDLKLQSSYACWCSTPYPRWHFLTSIVMPSPQVPPSEAWAFFDGSQDLSSTYISLLVGLDFTLTLLPWCLVPPACCFLSLFVISMLCSYLLRHLNARSWRWQVVVAHMLLRTISSHRAWNFGGVALPWHWLPFHHTL